MLRKSMALGMDWYFLKLLWPFQMKTAHLSFLSAQHNPRHLTFVHAGADSVPSPNILGHATEFIYSVNLRRSVVCVQQQCRYLEWLWKHHIPGSIKAWKATNQQISGDTVQCQQGKRTQHTDVCGTTGELQFHYLCVFVNWGVLQKNNVNLETCFGQVTTSSQQCWSLVWSKAGKYLFYSPKGIQYW